MDNFDPLIAHVKAFSKNMNREYVGALLRPYAWIIEPAMKQGATLDDILEATKQAGYQLISDGKMDETTLDIIAREIMPRDGVIKLMKQNFGEK